MIFWWNCSDRLVIPEGCENRSGLQSKPCWLVRSHTPFWLGAIAEATGWIWINSPVTPHAKGLRKALGHLVHLFHNSKLTGISFLTDIWSAYFRRQPARKISQLHTLHCLLFPSSNWSVLYCNLTLKCYCNLSPQWPAVQVMYLYRTKLKFQTCTRRKSRTSTTQLPALT